MFHSKHDSHYLPSLPFYDWKGKALLPSQPAAVKHSMQPKNRFGFHTFPHQVPTLPGLAPLQQSCLRAVQSHRNPSCNQIWNSKYRSRLLAATRAQHLICLWQVVNEVTQPDFHCSQAWTSHSHGEEGKIPRAVPFPSEPDTTTQRISLGMPVFFLSLLWLSSAGKEGLLAAWPSCVSADTNGATR